MKTLHHYFISTCLLVLYPCFSSAFTRMPKRFDTIENKNILKPLVRNDIEFSECRKVYNPSFLKVKGKEYLFVRIEGNEKNEVDSVIFYDSYIGVSERQVDGSWGAIKKINLSTKYAEDPRVIIHNGNIILFYNDLIQKGMPFRTVKIALLDDDFFVKTMNKVEPQVGYYEKNWVPFTIKSDAKYFYFIYSFSPFIVYKGSISEGEISVEKMRMPYESFYSKLSTWENNWDKIRGGTPLVQIDDNTLIGIFHSSFYAAREKKRWYVLGSIIVKIKDGNFYIERISKAPIIYKMMYSSKFSSTSDRSKRVLFPGGLYIHNNRAKVFLGVNDAFIQEIDFKLEDLIKGMVIVR